MDDRYLTVEKSSTAELKVKGSRFIARVDHASSVAAANEKLNHIRKAEHAATHNCYAYLIGIPADKAEFKFSDDGEPSGTAGRPIYDVIAGSGATNLLLVVTRYFGGTRLGTGGLVKAYSEAARLAMESAGIKERFITDRVRVEIEFPVYDGLLKAVRRLGARQVKSDFSDIVSLELEIRRSKKQHLLSEITELSKGKAKVEEI
ncbi:MAG: YigZ family protein [Candidatus Zixiibacteriota bacterium]|nr:MAG: YigZ family protein [candidate division Zixibacteria bacterium]